MFKRFLTFLLAIVSYSLVFSYEPDSRSVNREPASKQRIKTEKIKRTDKYFEEFEDNGTHTFLCSMSFLYYNKLNEEVRIQNNSSYKLRNVHCTISIQKENTI